MADSILSSLSSASGTLKIVNDSDTANHNQASELKISKITIQFRSRPMRHMKEDGNTIVDARIIDPVTLDIDVFAPSLASINLLNIMLQNRSSTYTVTSKGLVFKAMSTEALEIKQNADMLSASPVKISLKKISRPIVGNKVHKVVEQAADSSVVTKGIHAVSAVTKPVRDTFDKAIGSALPTLPNIPIHP